MKLKQHTANFIFEAAQKKSRINVNVPRNRPVEAQREGRCIALFLDLGAIREVGGQCHALAALPPGKTRYPSYSRQKSRCRVIIAISEAFKQHAS
jgi:hypothetical protein